MGTSRLSPHLHFGEIGARQVWSAVRGSTAQVDPTSGAVLLAGNWAGGNSRTHLLFHFPHTPEQPLRESFADFPWRTRPRETACLAARAHRLSHRGRRHARAVAHGLDAQSRAHDRGLVPGQGLADSLAGGAAWFWDTLVDADLANNTLGWQWTAGCGADAAPYFRIFNPVTQGEKFDPHGDYVRRWVPELNRLPRRVGSQAVGSSRSTCWPMRESSWGDLSAAHR